MGQSKAGSDTPLGAHRHTADEAGVSNLFLSNGVVAIVAK